MEVFRQVEHVVPPANGSFPSQATPPTTTGAVSPKFKTRQEYRQFRDWMKEVKGMARGWDGMWWGCAKDGVGFAIFFAVFESTRRLANRAVRYFDYPTSTVSVPPEASSSGNTRRHEDEEEEEFALLSKPLPRQARLAHGCILVSGGVLAGLAFELSARPFDNARRIAARQTQLQALSSTTPASPSSSSRAVVDYLRQNGIVSSLLRSPGGVATAVSAAGGDSGGSVLLQQRALILLRALGRLGPWGVGFLLWEGLAIRDG